MILFSFNRYVPDPDERCLKIRFLRDTLGLSIAEIAEQLDITRERVRQLYSREIPNPWFYPDGVLAESISGFKMVEVPFNGVFSHPPYIRSSQKIVWFIPEAGCSLDITHLFMYEYCPEGCGPDDFHDPVDLDLSGNPIYRECPHCQGGFQLRPPLAGTEVELTFSGTIIESGNELLIDVDPENLGVGRVSTRV